MTESTMMQLARAIVRLDDSLAWAHPAQRSLRADASDEAHAILHEVCARRPALARQHIERLQSIQMEAVDTLDTDIAEIATILAWASQATEEIR